MNIDHITSLAATSDSGRDSPRHSHDGVRFPEPGWRTAAPELPLRKLMTEEIPADNLSQVSTEGSHRVR